MTTRCDCCDLPVDSCGAQIERRRRGEELAERARLLSIPGAFPARYAGPCERCGEWFKVGDPIKRDERPGSWRCLLCCPPPPSIGATP